MCKSFVVERIGMGRHGTRIASRAGRFFIPADPEDHPCLRRGFGRRPLFDSYCPNQTVRASLRIESYAGLKSGDFKG